MERDLCAICEKQIMYLDPHGDVIGSEGVTGWWAHEIHPQDEHDAEPLFNVIARGGSDE